MPGTVTINPATLNITASSATMVYGAAAPPITASYVGFVGTDTVTSLTTAPTCSTTATSTSNVGTHPTTCSGAVDPNYTISYVAGTVTVTGAPLTITASSGTMVYGSSVPAITATFSGFVNGQTSAILTAQPTCSTTATSTSNVGSYPSTCSGAAAANYAISYVAGSVTVTAAPLTITASSAPMTYGGAVPTITPIYVGFLNGQTTTVLTTQPTCGTTATAVSPVGTYPSSCLGAAALNYTISYLPGTVTVGKAASTTTILANLPSPAIIGQIVTVNFGVIPQFSGVPTGSVKVTASTGETCTSALTAGVGSCSLTFFTGGSRTLTAVYSGDTNFIASTSAAKTQVVSNVSLSTFSLLFGDQLVGTRSSSQTVTLSNVGTTPLTITSINWSAGFSDATNCGTTLNAGRSCRINVSFVPTTLGVITGTLTITDSDVTSPQTVTLTGTGVQPAASLSPTSYGFGTVTRRTTSAPYAFTLSNPGTAVLTINSISLGGANPGQFLISSRTCGTTLAVGANCTINVTFAPTGRGAFTATLRVADNAPNSPQSVALSGTGQ